MGNTSNNNKIAPTLSCSSKCMADALPMGGILSCDMLSPHVLEKTYMFDIGTSRKSYVNYVQQKIMQHAKKLAL